MDASELRIALALEPESWTLTLRANGVFGEADPPPIALPFTSKDLDLFERALDLNGGTALKRTFSLDEIARLAELKLLRRAPAPLADADLCGHDIHREQLRAKVRGWLASILLEPLASEVNQHFAALRTARPGVRPILYLRLEFRPDRDLPLLRLPWELLHQHRLTNGDVHVGRYLRYEAAPGRLDPAPKLHLLVLESDPADDVLPHLRLQERERIVDGLKGTQLEGRFEVSPVVPAGYRAAQKALHALRDQPAIFHFACHGDFGWRCEHCRKLANTRDGNPCGEPDCGFQRHGVPMGFLAFTDPDTVRADWVSIDGLRNLLKRADVRLVVLNACKSAAGRGGADVFNGLAQQLMDLVPAVIATPFPLETRAAEEFAGLLYQGLGEGLPLVEALHEVQQAMAEPCPDEWYRPVLYLRSRQGDGGRLLETEVAESIPAATDHATEHVQSGALTAEQAAVGSSTGIPVRNAPTGSGQGEDRAGPVLASGPAPLRPCAPAAAVRTPKPSRSRMHWTPSIWKKSSSPARGRTPSRSAPVS
jgi:hypothetical protein